MNLQPGDRITYTPRPGEDDTGPRHGVYVRPETRLLFPSTDHWIRIDGSPGETYTEDISRLSRQLTLKDHDLHEIG